MTEPEREEEEEEEVRGPEADWPEPRESVGAFLLRKLYEMEDRVIQVYPQDYKHWEASDVAKRAKLFAYNLKELGVEEGDRVSFICASDPYYAPFMLGVWLLGATFAPLNPYFDKGDIERLLNIVQPAAIFCSDRAKPEVQEAARCAKPNVPFFLIGEGKAWQEFIKTKDSALKTPFNPVEIKDVRKAVAALICSRKYTKIPQCVIYTHFMIASMLNILNHKDAIVKSEQKVVITSPGFCFTGLFYMCFSMAFGAQIIYKALGADLDVLNTIHQYKATTLFTSNRYLLSLIKTCKYLGTIKRNCDLGPVHNVLCYGAILYPISHQSIQDYFGILANQIYVFTEMNIGIGLVVPPKQKVGSVGLLCATLRCKVVHPVNGKTLGPNEHGELRFKSSCLSPGYYNDPVSTAELFDEKGWLKSGDIGYYDEDNYFYITGRLENAIIWETDSHIVNIVYPEEIEDLLNIHPAVSECAVVCAPKHRFAGLPHGFVFVRLQDKESEEEVTKSKEDVMTYADELADQKNIRFGIRFLKSLPKTGTGKINRAQLIKDEIPDDPPGLDDPVK